jgi:hypothetical protein
MTRAMMTVLAMGIALFGLQLGSYAVILIP